MTDLSKFSQPPYLLLRGLWFLVLLPLFILALLLFRRQRLGLRALLLLQCRLRFLRRRWAVACVRLAEEFATAERARDGLAPAEYSAGPDSSPQEAHSEQAGCPAGSQAAYWRAGLVFRRSANSLAGCPVDPHSASPVSPEAVRAVACARLAEEFAAAERARDGLAPAEYSAEPDSSPQEARSEQAGCPDGSQAAHWRAGLVFRRLANSLAGCPVGPCSASLVSPEAVRAVACVRLAEEFAAAERARWTDWLRPGIRLGRIRHLRRLVRSRLVARPVRRWRIGGLAWSSGVRRIPRLVARSVHVRRRRFPRRRQFDPRLRGRSIRRTQGLHFVPLQGLSRMRCQGLLLSGKRHGRRRWRRFGDHLPASHGRRRRSYASRAISPRSQHALS